MGKLLYWERSKLQGTTGAYIMENQVELNSERLELRAKLKDALPDFMAAESGVLDIAYSNGALSAKIKRLMALAVALRAGCTNCILSQTTSALDEGATREEILETLQVVIAISGTTGIAESLRVIKLLEELGIE
jgi:AhpD family alkylhydroperoxidase